MPIVTIGNFDGVHIGHQALVRVASQAAHGGEVVALSFDTHPAGLVRGIAPESLTTLDERALLLGAAGATRVEMLHTTAELLSLEPESFVKSLHERLKFEAIVEGRDFRFGKGRAGDVAALERIGSALGFRTIVVEDVEAVLSDGHCVAVRSSTVRWLLSVGRVADAARMLGRSHRVSGVVVEGARRGRTLGFPTANIDVRGALLPADGVYAVRAVSADGSAWPGAASIGTNPMFSGGRRTLEVHVLGLPSDADLYGQVLAIDFTKWLREMMTFDSVDRLVEQIQRDCDRVPA